MTGRQAPVLKEHASHEEEGKPQSEPPHSGESSAETIPGGRKGKYTTPDKGMLGAHEEQQAGQSGWCGASRVKRHWVTGRLNWRITEEPGVLGGLRGRLEASGGFGSLTEEQAYSRSFLV